MSIITKKKIGILGGTFNPIHVGHLILAENAYSELNLDKVIFMPSGVSYLKDQSEILPAKVRFEMVFAAVKNNDHFEASDYEIVKSGNTYTYETLSRLNELNSDSNYYFIAGEDTLYSIETWKNPDIILKSCVLVIAPRNHVSNSIMIKKCEELQKRFMADIKILKTPDIDISSSMIRNHIKNDRSVRYYVPEEVNRFIIDNKYYK